MLSISETLWPETFWAGFINLICQLLMLPLSILSDVWRGDLCLQVKSKDSGQSEEGTR